MATACFYVFASKLLVWVDVDVLFKGIEPFLSHKIKPERVFQPFLDKFNFFVSDDCNIDIILCDFIVVLPPLSDFKSYCFSTTELLSNFNLQFVFKITHK